MATPSDRLRAAERIIDSIPPYAPEKPFKTGPRLCEHAATFSDWSETLVSTACAKNNVVAINQATLHLVNRYFMWRVNVPLRHQVLARPSAEHVCIFAIFESAYRRLQDAVLRLDPPPLAFPPPAPPPPPPPRPLPPRYVDLNGVGIAEILDEEFEP